MNLYRKMKYFLSVLLLSKRFFTKLFSIKLCLTILYLLSIVIGLSACSIFPSKHFPLSSATSETQTQVAQQQWQLSYDKEQYSLQVVVERTPTHWQWIMLNNLGQRLATATVTGSEIKIEQQQSHPANVLIPELLEAVQFSYWSLSDLQKMDGLNWSFQEHAGHRDIYFSGILRAAIDYSAESGNKTEGVWQGHLTYDNKKSNFHLSIESQLLN